MKGRVKCPLCKRCGGGGVYRVFTSPTRSKLVRCQECEGTGLAPLPLCPSCGQGPTRVCRMRIRFAATGNSSFVPALKCEGLIGKACRGKFPAESEGAA